MLHSIIASHTDNRMPVMYDSRFRRFSSELFIYLKTISHVLIKPIIYMNKSNYGQNVKVLCSKNYTRQK